MSTPEGKVKRKVTELLKKYPGLYYEMPVPGGYGKSGLDYFGCYKGRFFSVETKAPGKKPTDRQQLTIAAITRAGGAVFVIDGDLSQLKEWLDHHDIRSEEKPCRTTERTTSSSD